MDKKLQYLFFTVLAILLITCREQICQHFGFGQAKLHNPARFTDTVTKEVPDVHRPEVILLSDSVFIWDEKRYEFIPGRAYNPVRDEGSSFVKLTATKAISQPVPVSWQTLTRIQYTLKYFEEIGMEAYAPVFSDTLKRLNGRLVEVEGFVIPFEETGAEMALSANPFASCFFCGKASPASVMSLKVARHRKKYKMDDYLKFTGRLRLNYDDPKEFYYVLEGAKER